MRCKKVEVEVPDGYELIQYGLKIKFVRELNTKWEEKDTKVAGYYVNKGSKVVKTCAVPRLEKHSNIFHKESQAAGMISMAKLTQQLSHFNKDWKPDWFDDDKTKFCIVNDFRGGCGEFKVVQHTTLYRFLAFKTREDAEEFLEVNIDEIYLAKDFI